MNQKLKNDYQVAIIGAGPSGTCMASMLEQRGVSCVVLERSVFPRFSIGESLLPQCIDDLSEAGLLAGIEDHNFQFKNGAAFLRGDEYTDFDFSEKVSEGKDYAYQVKRSEFDKNLADQCERRGIPILYKHQVNDVQFSDEGASLKVEDLSSKENKTFNVKYVVDASGFGRVLPRLLDLNLPSDLPSRFSLFCHVKDDFKTKMDRDKILIIVSKKRPDVWYWMIPFSDGTVSVGAVGSKEYLSEELSDEEQFIQLLDECPEVATKMDYKSFERNEVKKIVGYSCGVKNLYGKSYVLLGNAGEFIDPVFSSGVTIACKSARIAAPLISRELAGGTVDWQKEYADKLSTGVAVFRAFVDLWYSGTLMSVFLAHNSNKSVKEMVCSILAGFAWDDKNPMVKSTHRRLNALVEWVEMSRPQL